MGKSTQTEIKLNYEIKKEDVVAFSVYHYSKSSQGKKQKYLLWALGPILFIAFYLVLLLGSFVMGSIEPYMVILVSSLIFIAVLGWIIFYPWLHRFIIMKSIESLISDKSNRTLFGVHDVTVIRDSITEKEKYKTTTYDWRAIQEFAEDEKHLYLYTSSIDAMIIPKSAFVYEEDKKQVVKWARRFVIPV